MLAQTPVDVIAAHRAALADYENEATELEMLEAYYTALLFRQAAAKRKALIERLETEQGQATMESDG